MTMIERNYTEELIHAYVDGQLSPDELSRFERLLVNDVELQEKVNVYKQQNALFHDAYDSILEEPIPTSITEIRPAKKSKGYLTKFVASVALLCIGSLIGWMMKGYETKSTIVLTNLAQTATIAHRVYTPEVKHPVEVSADQQQHLVKWLSKRMGKKISTPILDDFGFTLVGGRLLPSDTGPAAQFMYESKTGNRLTLFIRSNNSAEANTAFRYFEDKGSKAFYWIDGELGYVLVGNLGKEQLLDKANSVYHQLSF